MYQFSRSIYRELARACSKIPATRAVETTAAVAEACESAMLRLAEDGRYFARPTATLFRDIRIHFRSAVAARVSRDRLQHAPGARLPGPAAAQHRGVRRGARVPRQHPPRHALPARAAARARLLPLTSTSRSSTRLRRRWPRRQSG